MTVPLTDERLLEIIDAVTSETGHGPTTHEIQKVTGDQARDVDGRVAAAHAREAASVAAPTDWWRVGDRAVLPGRPVRRPRLREVVEGSLGDLYRLYKEIRADER